MVTDEGRPGKAETPRRVLRVLLVEDSAADVDLCLRLLRKAYPDVRCDVVDTTADFARQIRTSYYDVVLADYALQSWTGVAAFVLMRKAKRNFPFILVTGALSEPKAVECIKCGITDYVLKDHLESLPVAISRVLEEKELLEQHKRIAHSLANDEVKCRMLAETIPAATFIQQGGQCRYANPAAERITGYGREELWNMDFWNLLLPASKKAVAESGSPFDDDLSARRYELQIRTKQQQERWLDVTVGMFQVKGESTILITAFDITERKRAESKVYRVTDHTGESVAEGVGFEPTRPLRV